MFQPDGGDEAQLGDDPNGRSDPQSTTTPSISASASAVQHPLAPSIGDEEFDQNAHGTHHDVSPTDEHSAERSDTRTDTAAPLGTGGGVAGLVTVHTHPDEPEQPVGHGARHNLSPAGGSTAPQTDTVVPLETRRNVPPAGNNTQRYPAQRFSIERSPANDAPELTEIRAFCANYTGSKAVTIRPVLDYASNNSSSVAIFRYNDFLSFIDDALADSTIDNHTSSGIVKFFSSSKTATRTFLEDLKRLVLARIVLITNADRTDLGIARYLGIEPQGEGKKAILEAIVTYSRGSQATFYGLHNKITEALNNPTIQQNATCSHIGPNNTQTVLNQVLHAINQRWKTVVERELVQTAHPVASSFPAPR